MIEINLIPDVKRELLQAEGVRSTVVSAAIVVGIIALGVVLLLTVYIFGVQTIRQAIVDDQISKGGQKLANVEDLTKVLTIQNQLTKIASLNDMKKIDSRIFDMLLAVLPVDANRVQVSGITINADEGSVTLEGQTPSYDALEVFKKTINNAVIAYKEDNNDQTVRLATDISTTGVSFGENSSGTKVLQFTLSFTYAEELFSPQIAALTFKITGLGNATDSYIGIPRSIFTDAATDLEDE